MAKFRIRKFRQQWIIPSTILLSLVLMIVSCSETKVSRCNTLISAANRTTQEIQTLPGQTLQPKERFAKAADVLDRATRDVKALKIEDPTVQKLQTQLVELYTNDRNNNLVLATSNNAKDVRQALQNIQQNDITQKTIVKAANAYCKTPEKP